jgi:hypothetical protein
LQVGIVGGRAAGAVTGTRQHFALGREHHHGRKSALLVELLGSLLIELNLGFIELVFLIARKVEARQHKLVFGKADELGLVEHLLLELHAGLAPIGARKHGQHWFLGGFGFGQCGGQRGLPNRSGLATGGRGGQRQTSE